MDLARLRKIWNLVTSPNAGEAAAARDRARYIVEQEGKTLADVPEILRTTEQFPGSPPRTRAFELSPTESKLRAAVLKWCVFHEPPFDVRRIITIDGCDEACPVEKITARVREALSNAIPLPTTIAEGMAECKMWGARPPLDLPARFRRMIVINFVHAKVRENIRAKIKKAVPVDLEAATVAKSPPQAASGAPKAHPPAKARHGAVQGDMFEWLARSRGS